MLIYLLDKVEIHKDLGKFARKSVDNGLSTAKLLALLLPVEKAVRL
jgi:hypothetical protein